MTELYSDAFSTAEPLCCDRQHPCISARLAAFGVRYERIDLPEVAFDAHAECDEIISSYLAPLNMLMQTVPCVALDVTSVLPGHPRIAALQREFMAEHAHDVAEAQLMVWGRGVLFMRQNESDKTQVWALHCEAGDFVRLPAGLCHWFGIDTQVGFRTVRLFETNCPQGRVRRGRDMRGVFGSQPARRGIGIM